MSCTRLDAAVQGMGKVASAPYTAHDALADGRFLPLTGKFPQQETWFRTCIPPRSYKLARVQGLLDGLAAHLEGFIVTEPVT